MNHCAPPPLAHSTLNLEGAPRMALFGVPYPTREVGRESLCQVVELILVDTVRELTDLEQNSNVNSMD